eukprot:TRINITY_DN12039_c0_g1_i1.p1 TRINITY_DN12039_c0_g1~~TRINITY_DN12039_c0_g1_i1.p1  ORF type:complete len:607 (-),score=107.34 TRINITY_DN12039_c0_g1_i1:305-2125(-)
MRAPLGVAWAQESGPGAVSPRPVVRERCTTSLRNSWYQIRRGLQDDVERRLKQQDQLFLRLIQEFQDGEEKPTMLRGGSDPNGMDILELADEPPSMVPANYDIRKTAAAKMGPATPDENGSGTVEPPDEEMLLSLECNRRDSCNSRPSKRVSVLSQELKEQVLAEVTRIFEEDTLESTSKTSRRRLAQIADFVQPAIEWWHHLEEPDRSGRLYEIVTSNVFNFILTCIIFIDTIYSAYSANRKMTTPGIENTIAMNSIEIAFVFIYLVEIIAKLTVHRLYFFCNLEMAWNWFDFLLVVQAITDLIITYFVNVDSGNVSFIRLMRLLKIGKILRVFRAIRFLQELRVMLVSIINCFTALFWAFVTLALILYIFALMYVQSMIAFVEDPGFDKDDSVTQEVYKYFGSLETAALSLYQCASGGIDWWRVYAIVQLRGAVECAGFLFFIGFFNFAVLNILGGIFIEKALVAAQPDRESMALEQRRTEEKEAQELQRMISAMDADGSGTLTVEEFATAVENRYAKAYLSSLGLDIHDAVFFFNTLAELQGSDELDIGEVVSRLTRMKGNAKALDLQSVAFEISTMRKEFHQLFERSGTRKETSAKTVPVPT